jgi:uncharacterized protein YkwD
LIWSDALTKAAIFHTLDIGPKGLTQHESSDGTSAANRMKRFVTGWKSLAENIHFGDYNQDKGRRIILALLVDDGVPNRGHRTTLFNPDLNAVGIYTGPHAEYGLMTT